MGKVALVVLVRQMQNDGPRKPERSDSGDRRATVEPPCAQTLAPGLIREAPRPISAAPSRVTPLPTAAQKAAESSRCMAKAYAPIWQMGASRHTSPIYVLLTLAVPSSYVAGPSSES